MSTLDGLEHESTGRVAWWARRAFTGVLLLVVVAGGVGLLGVHTSRVSDTRAGYSLTLRYPSVSRAGLDSAWQVRLHHPGGFRHPVTLAVDGDYFGIYEMQGFHPDPATSTRDGRWLYLQFDPPPGDTFVVDFDAYIQPSSQVGRAARLSFVSGLADPRPLVSVDFSTRLLP